MNKTPLKFKKKLSLDSSDQLKNIAKPWYVLIVDDEPVVHETTKMILKNISYKNRPLKLLSAYNSEQAIEILSNNKDIALVFLDVVMETDDAGLQLTKYIRETLENNTIRIILRTGQPGQAPEESVIIDYDINDYKAKSELTSQKLFTCTIAALRTYDMMMALEMSRNGLNQILQASSQLFTKTNLKQFASGVLSQISALLECKPNGILFFSNSGDELCNQKILASTGDYISCQKCNSVDNCMLPDTGKIIDQLCHSHQNVYTPDHIALHFDLGDDGKTSLILKTCNPVTALDKQLLEVFSEKIRLGFKNQIILEELEQRVQDRTQELEKTTEKLSYLATHDPLTSLLNRRAFDANLKTEVERSIRYKTALSILTFDIDHFKRVNDEYGHGAGDTVLSELAPIIKNTLRQVDNVARMGGEEFAALLPSTNHQQAMLVAERLRADVERATFVDSNGHDIKITLSIGVVELEEVNHDIDTALKISDQRLYSAKNQGRNKVVSR